MNRLLEYFGRQWLLHLDIPVLEIGPIQLQGLLPTRRIAKENMSVAKKTRGVVPCGKSNLDYLPAGGEDFLHILSRGVKGKPFNVDRAVIVEVGALRKRQ